MAKKVEEPKIEIPSCKFCDMDSKLYMVFEEKQVYTCIKHYKILKSMSHHTRQMKEFIDKETIQIKAGDSVHYAPSGEEFLVACVHNDKLAMSGNLEIIVSVEDCELIRFCSEQDSVNMMKNWANRPNSQNDFRTIHNRKQLETVNPSLLVHQGKPNTRTTVTGARKPYNSE